MANQRLSKFDESKIIEKWLGVKPEFLKSTGHSIVVDYGAFTNATGKVFLGFEPINSNPPFKAKIGKQ